MRRAEQPATVRLELGPVALDQLHVGGLIDPGRGAAVPHSSVTSSSVTAVRGSASESRAAARKSPITTGRCA